MSRMEKMRMIITMTRMTEISWQEQEQAEKNWQAEQKAGLEGQ